MECVLLGILLATDLVSNYTEMMFCSIADNGTEMELKNHPPNTREDFFTVCRKLGEKVITQRLSGIAVRNTDYTNTGVILAKSMLTESISL